MSRIDWKDVLAKKFPRAFGGVDKPMTDEEVAEYEARQQERAERAMEQQRKTDSEHFLLDRGERYRDCRLSTFHVDNDPQAVVVDRLRKYAEQMPHEVESGNGIILTGPSGTGKDHLLVAIAYAAIRHYGIPVAWQNGVELYAQFREAIDGRRDERDIIRPLTNHGVLVLSDPLPPRGALTEYQMAMLYRILETRYSKRYPTWATLNVGTAAEASSRLGAACHDRLRDGALCLHCGWRSYRKPQP